MTSGVGNEAAKQGSIQCLGVVPPSTIEMMRLPEAGPKKGTGKEKQEKDDEEAFANEAAGRPGTDHDGKTVATRQQCQEHDSSIMTVRPWL